ncbi:Prolyl oligopeptidase family protein [compost metagenome]
MKKFSPIEFNSPRNSTEFFIVTGADDSRVNAVHSYKLSESLREQGIKADLFSIKNGGHFAESMSVQNTIGWRTQAVIWAKIFQHAGLEF